MRHLGALLLLTFAGVLIGTAQEKKSAIGKVPKPVDPAPRFSAVDGIDQPKIAPPPAEEKQKAKQQYDQLMDLKQKIPKMFNHKEVAVELYQIASESKHAATKLLFLRQAAEVGAGYNNAVAHKACDDLLRIYDGPTSDYVTPALRLVTIKSLERADAPIAYGLSTRALDADIAAEDFEAAAGHIRNLATLYRFFGDPTQVRQQPMILQKSIDDAKQLKEKAAAAEAVLKTKPTEAAANLTTGQYLCLHRGQWKAGLPRLAKGSDAKLKNAATKELAGTGDNLAGADAWFDLLPTLEAHAKRMTAAHVIELYAKALKNSNGADKARIEGRIEEAAKLINGL